MKKRVCTTKDYLGSGEKFEIVWSEYNGIARTYPKPLKNKLKEYLSFYVKKVGKCLREEGTLKK